MASKETITNTKTSQLNMKVSDGEGFVEFELNVKLKFKTIEDIDKAAEMFNCLLSYAESSLKSMKEENK